MMLTVPGHSGREDLAAYVERDGYLGLVRAVVAGPAAVRAAVRAAGLRGRGGSGRGEPAADKWDRMARARSAVRYLIANGAESNPDSRKDRLLLTDYPHRVLEGLLIAALASGAGHAFVYIKETYAEALQSIKQAIAEARSAGAWGPLDVEVAVYEAPDVYVAGEESAAVDAIEGFKRPRPRLRPPPLTQVGLFGHPTLVNNVETLAEVPCILRTGQPVTTLLVTLIGDVHRPGVYEIPAGLPLRALIEEYGGGATGAVRLVQPGGVMAGPLLPDELDLPVDYDALLRAGTTLGPAVVRVFAGDGFEPAAALAEAAGFWAAGSCGQCEICADGTARLRAAAEILAAGGPGEAPRAKLQLWAMRLRGMGNCAHAGMSAAAAQRWLRALKPPGDGLA